MGRIPGPEADLEAARDRETRADHQRNTSHRTCARRIQHDSAVPRSFVDVRMLALSCPAWCNGRDLSPMCFSCAVHAVEDGDLDPHNVAIRPVPAQGHDAAGGR